MCGIVGIISKHGSLPFYADNLFTNLIQMDSIRGPDSTGVFGVTGAGHVDYLKGDTDGYMFTRSKNYTDFKNRVRDYRIVIGHNRKATTGTISAANAHPFQEKHIILVHNGTLRSTDKLEKTDVDSHAIAHALADHNPVEALKLLNGAYALVWWDATAKTLSLARNSERPLSLLNYAATWVISSEVGLPLWLQSRESRRIEKEGMITVPEKKILVFKLDQLDKAPYEVPYEEYKFWTAPTVPAYKAPNHNTWCPPYRAPDNGSLLKGNTGQVIHMQQGKSKNINNPLLKAGEKILIELDDAKSESGAEVLLGSPIFDNEKDENIIVRYVLEKHETYMKYFGDKSEPRLWYGTIIHVRNMAGIPTLFLKDLVPYVPVLDAQNEANDADEVTAALKGGCMRCKGEVTVADVPTSIVRKKKDGGWRIVCPKCLTLSIEAAKERQPNLRTRVIH